MSSGLDNLTINQIRRMKVLHSKPFSFSGSDNCIGKLGMRLPQTPQGTPNTHVIYNSKLCDEMHAQ